MNIDVSKSDVFKLLEKKLKPNDLSASICKLIEKEGNIKLKDKISDSLLNDIKKKLIPLFKCVKQLHGEDLRKFRQIIKFQYVRFIVNPCDLTGKLFDYLSDNLDSTKKENERLHQKINLIQHEMKILSYELGTRESDITILNDKIDLLKKELLFYKNQNKIPLETQANKKICVETTKDNQSKNASDNQLKQQSNKIILLQPQLKQNHDTNLFQQQKSNGIVCFQQPQNQPNGMILMQPSQQNQWNPGGMLLLQPQPQQLNKMVLLPPPQIQKQPNGIIILQPQHQQQQQSNRMILLNSQQENNIVVLNPQKNLLPRAYPSQVINQQNKLGLIQAPVNNIARQEINLNKSIEKINSTTSIVKKKDENPIISDEAKVTNEKISLKRPFDQTQEASERNKEEANKAEETKFKMSIIFNPGFCRKKFFQLSLKHRKTRRDEIREAFLVYFEEFLFKLGLCFNKIIIVPVRSKLLILNIFLFLTDFIL
jgi:hypothetical protein